LKEKLLFFLFKKIISYNKHNNSQETGSHSVVTPPLPMKICFSKVRLRKLLFTVSASKNPHYYYRASKASSTPFREDYSESIPKFPERPIHPLTPLTPSAPDSSLRQRVHFLPLVGFDCKKSSQKKKGKKEGLVQQMVILLLLILVGFLVYKFFPRVKRQGM
jgi:hypothetical protein